MSANTKTSDYTSAVELAAQILALQICDRSLYGSVVNCQAFLKAMTPILHRAQLLTEQETVPLTEESEAEKKGVEDVISIGCLTRRPPPDQRGRVSFSRMYRGRKNDNRTKLGGEHRRRNETTNDEGGWKDCNVSSGEVCVSAGPETCQSLHPCADDPSTSPTQVVPRGGARRPARSFLVAAEEGEELRLSCNGPRGTTSLWTHTGAGDATMPPSGGRTLRFGALQRKHARRYTCHSISASGRLTLADVTLVVQFPPVIQSLRVRNEEGLLECSAAAVPPPQLVWLQDEDLSNSNELKSSERQEEPAPEGCLQVAILQIGKHSFRRSPLVAVVASNASVIRDQDPLDGIPMKRFKITGFIIGMLPPLFISFYIILKLGYRSRYAEERPEETGMMEEPFFISN
ncbi:hypothetical protein HPB47_022958 [Ixodes persulcatus]|uniref:Uncharacterized protein n=1 Tax=Ixodes persulcatus TaxID=34615 RepID=A0AC60Q8A3_IXOPE|nr:hypothetical protein HPB47_022958 [Ixodes persulcatus]